MPSRWHDLQPEPGVAVLRRTQFEREASGIGQGLHVPRLGVGCQAMWQQVVPDGQLLHQPAEGALRRWIEDHEPVGRAQPAADAAFVVAAVVTPPDVVSQIMLAIPLWMLYEVGILVSIFIEKPRESSPTS